MRSRGNTMRIEQLMNQPAVTCRTNDTLQRAAQLMWDCDCGSIAVVDDQGILVGMITDRDICMAAYTRGALLTDMTVASTMATTVFACRAGDDIESAERLMADHQIHRVPVVDDERRPVGIISVSDVARHAASARNRNGVVQTLAAITTPRSRVLDVARAAP